jgi:diguanylate cyclase (GGDEF)-like protein
MESARSYRDRVRHRPDSEHGQALLRLVIISLLLIDTAWLAARDPARAAQLWALNGGSLVFSLLLLTRILHRPHASPRRRVLGAIHDNVAATLWLYTSGPLGALALFCYPFVTVGNGFRFGVRYLAWSGFLGALGISTLILAAPAWRPHAFIGTGVLLSHVVVTIYTGVLLAQLRRTQAQLERMATCDVLTGLPNRRFFMERLAHLVASPAYRPLACLYLDLDGFKSVNDRCGHRVGDELLTMVGREILACIRPADLLARIGGDEFTVVLDGPADVDEARQVAGRIIAAIEGIAAVYGHPVTVSASVGVSFVPAGGVAGRTVAAEELLRAADDAMYAAKRSGKGRQRLAELAPVIDAAA